MHRHSVHYIRHLLLNRLIEETKKLCRALKKGKWNREIDMAKALRKDSIDYLEYLLKENGAILSKKETEQLSAFHQWNRELMTYLSIQQGCIKNELSEIHHLQKALTKVKKAYIKPDPKTRKRINAKG